MTVAPASTTPMAVVTEPASIAPVAMATAPASTAPIVTAEPVDTALREEVSFLRAAHLALDRGDATRALGLLDRYADAYPRGTLEEESLATRALSLCALARVAAAKDVARRLESLAPRSPYLTRVRASCAGGDNETK
jgi:hypothetical protein